MHLIIGAGPAGLFCAHELIKHNTNPVILEKEVFVGGLAATHEFEGCKFEVGPHILYTQDQYILDIAGMYLGNDLIHKEWSVAQFVGGKLLKFPNSAWDMTKKLGVLRMSEFLISYLKYRGIKSSSYSEFIYSKVGKKLAEFSVINYTEKMWGVEMDELETEWIKPRLDRFSLKEILKNTLYPKNRDYYYPRFGSGQLYRLMEQKMDVRTSEYPISIHHRKGRITDVKTNLEAYQIDSIFSSLPLRDLLALLSPAVPKEVLKAANRLRHRSQIYVVISLAQDRALNFQWIYFNERTIPFCRVHEPKNFTDNDAKPGKTVVVTEYFCFFKDKMWNMPDEQLYRITIGHLSSMDLVSEDRSSGFKIIRKKNAYPMMVTTRSENISVVNQYLDHFENLYSIGRHGLHTFDNQDTAGRSGIEAARLAMHVEAKTK